MRKVLRRLLAGELTEAEAEAELRRVQLLELAGRARLDIGRRPRRGLPEVVLAMGKQPADAARLTVAMALEEGQGLASRLDAEHWREMERQVVASGLTMARYHSSVRVMQPGFVPEARPGRVGILTAGTSDLPAADEARMVVEACGHEVRLEADLGVAALHRLFTPLAEMLAWGPDVVIVAAGMDGVLPGVVTGLVDVPVVGLPVGVGYGAGGRGEAALLAMLQSCSTGLVTVNIDNGIGAGAAAVLIAGRVGTVAAEARRPRPARARRESAGPAR